MNENVPLSVMLETAKSKCKSAINGVLADTKLPAYLFEGIIVDILAELRERKAYELMNDLQNAQKTESK